MRRLWGILLAALISTGAHAQSTARVGYAADGNGSQPFTYVSSSTPLPVSGSFSAGSFAPGGNYATLTSTASSADAALPTGTTVALFNTGTTAVSCILSVGAGTATASKNVIQASSWFAVVPGANTHYSCINQAGDGASNVVVASGGSGLPAGAGGGGGSSSNASVGSTGSAVPSSATYVGITSGGNLTGWDGSINLTKMGGTSINSGCVAALNTYGTSIPATVCGVWGVYVLNGITPGQSTMSGSQPVAIASNQTWGDPCFNSTATRVTKAISQAGAGAIITGTALKNTYICGGSFNLADAESISVVEGTTSSTPCDTGAFALVGSTTVANGMALAANEGLSMGTGGFSNIIANHTTGDNVCILQSGSGRGAGWVTYVQQ